MSLSRRNFLKGGLAGSVAAVAVGSNVANAEEMFADIKKIPHASHYGAFYAHVQNGKIIDVSPQESDKRHSSLIRAFVDRNYASSRIKYPYVRKSYLEGNANHKELRGQEEFIRVSWDKALELVASKIKACPKENIYNGSYGGWSHPGTLNSCATLTGKFFNIAVGGAIGTAGEYSNGAAGPTNPGIVGDMEVYSLQTAHEEILANTEVYVLWGTDLFKTNKIDYGVANHKNDEYYIKYRQSNIKFISIDPIRTETAKMLNAESIYIRPNTDVALMLGMMHHLYTTKKYDKAFIETYTQGFDKFIPYVLGKTDSIAKTPEWASKITEISAAKIKSLAELFISKKTFLAGNWAMQRAHHGEQVDWALITLASMLGQIGTPGGGFGFSMHYSGGGQAASGKTGVGGFSQGRNKVKIALPASRISEAILNPGKEISYKGSMIKFPHIKLMYIAGANIVGHHPDTNELVRALRTLETFIVQEPWWTPTAKMADIVLPSTTTLERDDIGMGGSYSGDYIYAMKKVVETPYEAKDDYEIFTLLSAKFGEATQKKFTDGMTVMEHLKKFYEASDAAKVKSFEDFWKEGFAKFEIPESAYKFVRHSAFRSDPIKNPLKTESGKIQIFSEKYANFGYVDFKGHPTWFEPAEFLGSKEAATYPLHMLSPHPTYRGHSQLDNSWLTTLYKVQGREPVRINPKDAKKYGIANGDVVEVYNARGRILAGAVVTEDIRPSVIAIEEGAWYSPEGVFGKDERCNSGHCNVLTSSRPSSQMAQATSVNTTLVAIKKAEGVEKQNAAYTAPKTIDA
ncbi:MAG: twin-arginine translocation signal domain-containing protein [Bacilli bacterium]|nr:twin-arginine translocation signal domain-containing protein [Bacilli bacterium]